jgi:energy-converting hydrogenase A subunit M
VNLNDRYKEVSSEAHKLAKGIMTAYRKTTTVRQPLLDQLNLRAQDMLAAIDLLTAAVDCADLKATAQDDAADLGEEFTSASNALTQAFAGLK